MSLKNEGEGDETNKETVNWAVGTNYCGKMVDEDKEVRVGIKDWLVYFPSYKNNYELWYLGKTLHQAIELFGQDSLR